MPGKPTSEENIQVPEEDREKTVNEYPEQVVRELTQTDQLNKKLLTSCLQRMNNSPGEFILHMDNHKQNDPCNPAEDEF